MGNKAGELSVRLHHLFSWHSLSLVCGFLIIFLSMQTIPASSWAQTEFSKLIFRTCWLTLTLLCLLRRNSDSPHRCSALIPALGELFWMKAPAKSQICKCDVLICSPFFVLIRVFWFSPPVFISLMSIPLSRCLPRLPRCLLVAAH